MGSALGTRAGSAYGAHLLTELGKRYAAVKHFVADPVGWSAAKTKAHMWSRQAEIMDSVRDNRYTAVHSAHDLGKSYVAAQIMAWWIDTHPIGQAFVVSTAPSAAQVSAILWREVSKAHRIAKLFGKINRAGYPQWYYDGELIGYGRKPADYEDSAFQGIHAKYVLVVIDEACGVAKHLYDAVDALVTNEHSRVLAIGNPDNPGSHFASICTPGSAAGAGWNVIHLDGLRSPNMSAEQIIGEDPDNPRYPRLAALMAHERIPYSTESVPEDLRPYLLAPLWVEERLARWAGVSPVELSATAPPDLPELVGRRAAASSLVAAKVRGMFPPSTTEGVIPMGWVQMAINRWRDYVEAHTRAGVLDTSHAPNPSAFCFGIDVARGGEDETAFAPRYGELVPMIHRMRVADTIEVAEAAAVHLGQPRSIAVVDVIGLGAGVYDYLRRLKRQGKIGATPMMFVASASTWRTDAIGAFRFRNDRSAAWWKMRQLLDPSRGHSLMLPDDERLLEELVAPRWRHLENGVISVETKDDIKKRLGRSTDTADAVIQAFWPSGAMMADPESYDPTGGLENRAAPADLSVVVYPSGYRPVNGADLLSGAGTSPVANRSSAEITAAALDDLFAGAPQRAPAAPERPTVSSGPNPVRRDSIVVADPYEGGWEV
jgi:hypothetical protein